MSDGFLRFLEDQFAPIPGVGIRKMFGGLGVFRDGIMFGLGADDVLYLRADEQTRGRYEAEGLKPFTYPMRGKDMALPYWQAPEAIFEDPDAFRDWADEAFAVAKRAKQAKPAKAKKKATSKKGLA